MGNVNYSERTTPPDYNCSKCGATGCKLWLRVQVAYLKLLCAECACKDQDESYIVDDDGMHTSDVDATRRTYTIGWYKPAVPVVNGHGCWDYQNIPNDGMLWWKRLPLRTPAG